MNKRSAYQVIVTLGPTSLNEEVLTKLGRRPIAYVRINLSHTPLASLEETIRLIRRYCSVPLMLDTEGSQVRTGVLGSPLVLRPNQSVLVTTQGAQLPEAIVLRPDDVLGQLHVGDIVTIDFDSVVLRVDDVSDAHAGRLACTVMSGGTVQSNKAVTVVDQAFSLPPLSEKDKAAVAVALDTGISDFCLSFTDAGEDVLALRSLHPTAYIVAKIETRRGIHNLDSIMRQADALLIDRGDLSREVPVERLPFAQKHVIARGRAAGRPVFVATNFLDTMMEKRSASRAETNDIVNTLLDGATGLVLAAETAIGKHPIETVSFLLAMCDEVSRASGALSNSELVTDVLAEVQTANYVTSPALGCGLISPHGGVLVDQRWEGDLPDGLPELELTEEEAMDAEQLALGAYSPVRGFMGREELEAVLSEMRLPDGTVWPVPILLRAHGRPVPSGMVRLTFRGTPFAVMEVVETYSVDWRDAAGRFFGTTSDEHPGVRAFLAAGGTAVAGRVWITQRLDRAGKRYELAPAQTRRLMEARGWTLVVAFHTRNAPHKAHEFVMEEAVRRTHADGILIHPAVGKKKSGDFTTRAITEGFEALMDSSTTLGRAMFATFPTYSRYAGPREALFTALCRQNYGCTHFIVGRDHTGVSNFYNATAAQDIFSEFSDIAIEPVFFAEVRFSRLGSTYAFDISQEDALTISGTEARATLLSGSRPPDWYQRRAVADAVLALGPEAFVE